MQGGRSPCQMGHERAETVEGSFLLTAVASFCGEKNNPSSGGRESGRNGESEVACFSRAKTRANSLYQGGSVRPISLPNRKKRKNTSEGCESV